MPVINKNSTLHSHSLTCSEGILKNLFQMTLQFEYDYVFYKRGQNTNLFWKINLKNEFQRSNFLQTSTETNSIRLNKSKDICFNSFFKSKSALALFLLNLRGLREWWRFIKYFDRLYREKAVSSNQHASNSQQLG